MFISWKSRSSSVEEPAPTQDLDKTLFVTDTQSSLEHFEDSLTFPTLSWSQSDENYSFY